MLMSNCEFIHNKVCYHTDTSKKNIVKKGGIQFIIRYFYNITSKNSIQIFQR